MIIECDTNDISVWIDEYVGNVKFCLHQKYNNTRKKKPEATILNLVSQRVCTVCIAGSTLKI